MQRLRGSSSGSLFWPVLGALALHIVLFGMLFVSFSRMPDLPPSRPVIQATLYQLQSQSQATAQTTQKTAGEAKKTAAPQHEVERLEQKKAEEQRLAQARQREAQKKAEAEKRAAEQKRQAEIARKRTAEQEKKRQAEEAARKRAADEAKKKAAAAEQEKRRAAAETARKQVEEEAQRKTLEEQKAAALAELLSDKVERQQTLAQNHGDQVAGNLDDLIIRLITENWQKPMSARPGMSVELMIRMLPDGTITQVTVVRSSGDAPFDASALAAVRNVGRIPEMRELDRMTFDRLYRQRPVIFKPED